jgi:hypothetical protein
MAHGGLVCAASREIRACHGGIDQIRKLRTPFLQLLHLHFGTELQHHRNNHGRLQRLPEQNEHGCDGEQVRHGWQSASVKAHVCSFGPQFLTNDLQNSAPAAW